MADTRSNASSVRDTSAASRRRLPRSFVKSGSASGYCTFTATTPAEPGPSREVLARRIASMTARPRSSSDSAWWY